MRKERFPPTCSSSSGSNDNSTKKSLLNRFVVICHYGGELNWNELKAITFEFVFFHPFALSYFISFFFSLAAGCWSSESGVYSRRGQHKVTKNENSKYENGILYSLVPHPTRALKLCSVFLLVCSFVYFFNFEFDDGWLPSLAIVANMHFVAAKQKRKNPFVQPSIRPRKK